MKKTLVYLLASLVVLMFTVPASAGIEWSGNVSVGLEKLSYGTKTNVNDDLQFTDAQVNLNLNVEIADGVKAVVELRNFEWIVWERSARIELANLIPNATLMVGKVVFPMGKEADTESETGNLMKNAMIGNSALHDEGLTGSIVDYGMLLKTAMGPVNCLLGISNGNYGWASDNNSKKAMGIRLDGDVEAVPGLSLAASYGTNDASDENETDKVRGMVLDAAYAMDALKVGVTYGDGEIKYGAAGSTEKEKLDGLAIQASYAVSDVCSVAVRHSKVEVDNGIGDYKVRKLQLGINYKLADNTLLKIEYVDNKNKEKPINLDTDDDYDGIKAAIAVAF